jgi:hypothetical protein
MPPARDVVRSHRGQTRFVVVEDDRFLADVNTPEDYRRFLAKQHNVGQSEAPAVTTPPRKGEPDA